MLIKNDFEVAQPVDKVWQFFDDIPQVAACLPGAELTDDLGDDKYLGKVAIRMGPVKMQFAGTAADQGARRGGQADRRRRRRRRREGSRPGRMLVTAKLSPAGRGTKVEVAQDLQLSGAAAQYGRGMISDVTAVLMRDFADQHAEADRGRSNGPVTGPGRAAAPASGFAIGLRAMRMALTRVFRASSCPTSPTRAEEDAHGAVVDRQRDAAAGRGARPGRAAQPGARRARTDPRGVRRHPRRRGRADRRAGRRARDAGRRPTSTIDEVAVGAVRYAGSVAKLLG